MARRFKGMTIPNHPAHAADRQTERVGDFAVSKLAYHVTAAPSMDVLQKCAENLKLGLQPILLVPCDQKPRARVLAEEVGVDKNVVITSIEDFVALNIIELATEENKDFHHPARDRRNLQQAPGGSRNRSILAH